MKQEKIKRILDNLEKAISALIISIVGMVSYMFVNVERLIPMKILVFRL